MNQEMILILDFGGQYNQLIARRVREHHVYCEIMPWKKSLEEIKAKNPKGIIFTGGPNSVYDDASPKVDPALFALGVPILGICYGCQLIAYTLGGKVGHAAELSEYGKAEVAFDTTSKLLKGIGANEICWMSHTDYVTELPEGFRIIGKTPTCPAAAIECEAKGFYGVQFHPEVNHTPKGSALIKNFLFEVCGCKGDWTMTNYIEDQIKKIRDGIGTATQDVFLFSDTVEGNIAFGDQTLTEDEVHDFARRAAADDFIKGLSEGYDTIIGERGVGLSGGQKQRIALARALAVKPGILVMDDTTSAVDMETEKYIQAQLRQLPYDCTKLIIAQRISSVKDADLILILKDGVVTERGTHQELLRQRGYYYETYCLQNGITPDTAPQEVM